MRVVSLDCLFDEAKRTAVWFYETVCFVSLNSGDKATIYKHRNKRVSYARCRETMLAGKLTVTHSSSTTSSRGTRVICLGNRMCVWESDCELMGQYQPHSRRSDAKRRRPSVVVFYSGVKMREETKKALADILAHCEASGDSNIGEACRVVTRDLLNGGRSAYVPVVKTDPKNAEAAEVVFKPKKKR